MTAERSTSTSIPISPTTSNTAHPNPPTERFSISDGSTLQGARDSNDTESASEEPNYPTGTKLYLNIASVLITLFLHGLDLTIVAVSIPALTDQFNTLADIGWYSATYGLALCSFLFLFGKIYTMYSVKKIYLISLIIFEIGSLICTVAPASAVFIVGRAVAGFAAAGLVSGAFTIVTQSLPLRKRPLVGGIAGAVQTLATIASPVIGGALIDGFSWRACFGINLPLGVMSFILTYFTFQNPVSNPDIYLPWREKLKRLDLLGTFVFVPSITCLLLGLQWGGTRYGWANFRIILLMVLFGVLLIIFGYLQYRQQDKATLPPRILLQRSIFLGSLFAALCNGALAVTEYYMSIYFQTVRGYSATQFGLFAMPMVIGLCIAALLAGAGTSAFGYYVPFMLLTTLLTPIASGLLTTLDLTTSLPEALSYLGLLGFGIGLGIQGPQSAAQTILNPREISIGISLVSFGSGLGSSLFVSASSALFQNRLVEELKLVGGVDAEQADALRHTGLTQLRSVVGEERLRDVLLGYDKAVTQTLYLVVALTTLTVVSSAGMEWRSVKVKKA